MKQRPCSIYDCLGSYKQVPGNVGANCALAPWTIFNFWKSSSFESLCVKFFQSFLVYWSECFITANSASFCKNIYPNYALLCLLSYFLNLKVFFNCEVVCFLANQCAKTVHLHWHHWYYVDAQYWSCPVSKNFIKTV